jgi:hypothetical protein
MHCNCYANAERNSPPEFDDAKRVFIFNETIAIFALVAPCTGNTQPVYAWANSSGS